MVSVAVGRILKRHRALCNRWFAETRHRYPHLDAQVFAQFLQQDAAVLLAQVERAYPDQLEALVLAVYRHGLLLTGLRWCGADSGFVLLQRAWQRYLPECCEQLLQAPERVLIAFAHALRQLQDHPAADGRDWLHRMLALAPLLPQVDDWLRAGQVLAWRCGLAHYRESALQQAQQLNEVALLLALDASGRWPQVREQLQRNRWWRPGDALPLTLQEQRRIGALAGMGGVFTALPQVMASGERLFVISGQQHFELFADGWGASLQPAPAPDVAENIAPASLQVMRNRVQLGQQVHTVSDIHAITSVACTGDTVALTSADSFQVILLSRGGAA